MNALKGPNSSAAGDICLVCGLCCNGVIFARVEVQPGEDAERLKALGLPLTRSNGGRGEESKLRPPRSAQPCAVFDGCRCRIYAERPKYCREFECALLKQVSAGQVDTASALSVIRSARHHAEGVRRLLRALGDTEEQSALSMRFRRTTRRLSEAGLDGPAAEAYGQLTLAVHELNLLLSETFYPGRL